MTQKLTAQAHQSFKGFPGGKVRLTRIPSLFFIELLPQIDDLNELKVTLYALWYLDQMEGSFRFLRYKDFTQDKIFMQGLGEKPLKALENGIQGAIDRGTLLQAELQGVEDDKIYLFLNTPRGRAAVEAIAHGDWRPTGDARQPIALELDKPNIYRLYEENIGPLTPMIAEMLKEAEQTYPSDWIDDAMHIAVENNVRRWRYIEAILKSWQKEGRNDQNRGDTEKDRRRYIEGPFAEFVIH
jgi:DNA replication protein